MAWSLAGAGLLLALGQGVVQAATITVTTNNPNIAADGQFFKWLDKAAWEYKTSCSFTKYESTLVRIGRYHLLYF